MDKRKIFMVVLLVAVGLFALMVLAGGQGSDSEQNNVVRVSPGGRQNVSGNLLLNITVGDRLPQNVNITNVTVLLLNYTDVQNSLVSQIVINDSDRAVNLTFNKTTNTAVAATGLSDGYYNLSIKAYNVSDNRIVSNNSSLRGDVDGGTYFVIDNTFPEIRGKAFNTTDRINYTTGDNATVLATVTNTTGHFTGTALHAVTFQFSNQSNPFNKTGVVHVAGTGGAVLFAPSYNVTPNIAAGEIVDGNHTVTVFVNDTAGNLNGSVTMFMLVDTVPPRNLSLQNVTERYNSSKNIVSVSWNTTDNIADRVACDVYIDGVRNITAVIALNNTLTNFTGDRSIADGVHTFNVQCNDSVRLQGLSMVTNFTIDTVVPDVQNLLSPTNKANFTNLLSAQSLLLNASISNNSGTAIHAVIFQINNGSNAFNITGVGSNTTLFNNTINITTYAITEGNHSVLVFANDTAGNVNFTQNATFLVDLTAPDVTLLNMTERFNISKSNVTFQWNSTDTWAASTTCQIVVNSNINITDQTIANGTAGGSTTLQSNRVFADGVNNVNVMCNDTVRKQGTSIIRNFTVDTVVPDVQNLLSPTNKANFTNLLSAQSLLLNASISNNSGTAIHAVIFQINNGSNAFNITGVGSNTTLFNNTINVTTYAITDGNHSVLVFANDTAGNLNRSNAQNISILVDTVPPSSVTVQNVTERYNSSKNVISFSWLANDTTSDRMQCDLYIDQRLNTSSVLSVHNTVTNATSATMGDGVHTFNVQCNDSVKLQNITMLFNFTVDTVAVDTQSVAVGKTIPESGRLNVTTGDNITFNASVQNLSGTAIHSVIFQVMNGTNSSGTQQYFNLTAGANSNGTNGTVVFYAASVPGLNLAEGNHTVIIFANDTAGNMNNSRRTNVTFLVDKTAPSVVELYNLTEGYNSSDTTPWFVWQVNDSFSPTMVCELYINRTLNVSRLNVTNGSQATFTVGTAMSEGHYNWSVSCNDSVRQMNSSHVRNLTIDTTVPSIVLTKSASTTTSLTLTIATTSDALTCTSSHAGASITGGPGGSQTLTESSLSAGTSYIYVVTCSDTSGNQGNAELTVSTDSEAGVGGAGGGGGGGGGGGAAPAAPAAPAVTPAPARPSAPAAPAVVKAPQRVSLKSKSASRSFAGRAVAGGEVLEAVFTLEKGKEAVFNVVLSSTKAEEDHKFVIDEVTEDSATVTITSQPATLTLKVGESKDLDMDGDKSMDLRVTLRSVDPKKQSAEVVLTSLNVPPKKVSFGVIGLVLGFVVLLLVVLWMVKRRRG